MLRWPSEKLQTAKHVQDGPMTNLEKPKVIINHVLEVYKALGL